MVPVILPQHFYNIFADVVDIAFHNGQYDGVALRFAGLPCLHLFFDFIKSRLGRVRRHQKLGQEQRLFAKAFPHRVEGGNDVLVDDLQRRFIFSQQFFCGAAALLCQPFHDGVVQGVFRNGSSCFGFGRIGITGHKFLAACIDTA